MKRYKLHERVVNPDFNAMPAFIPKMIEDPNGEWVKWEDVKRILQYKDQLKGFKLEGEILECNCEEMASKNWTIEVEGDTTILKGYWICPIHGYKRT